MSFTLFTRPGCRKSEILRCVLIDKSIEHRLVDISKSPGLEMAEKVFPLPASPAIADKDAILSDFDVIIEYLDERYPVPQLLPQGPQNRATVRIFYRRLITDLYPLLDRYLDENCKASREELRRQVDFLSGIINSKQFLLSNDVSVADYTLMPVVSRLINDDVPLPGPMKQYYQRLISLDAFATVLR
jgi:glutathione S-transferase